MGFKFKLTCLLLIAMGLATTVLAIDCLNGITYWDVAEINGITIGEFHPIPWRFQSDNANANSGTVEAQNVWSGTWKEVGCNTIYCEMTSGGFDSWYLTFVNPKYFMAYKKQNGYYPLYRLGKMEGEAYFDLMNTIVGVV